MSLNTWQSRPENYYIIIAINILYCNYYNNITKAIKSSMMAVAVAAAVLIVIVIDGWVGG